MMAYLASLMDIAEYGYVSAFAKAGSSDPDDDAGQDDWRARGALFNKGSW